VCPISYPQSLCLLSKQASKFHKINTAKTELTTALHFKKIKPKTSNVGGEWDDNNVR